MEQKSNIIYILTNEAMPGMIKIGKTHRPIEQRMKDLFSTGVPVPFECFHASVVEDADEVERRLHRAFVKDRINKNREFFQLEPENVLEILELLEIKNVTPNDEIVESPDDLEAMKHLENRAERFSFKLVGIPLHAMLQLDKDETITCQVLENNKVLYEDQEMSLSMAALEALKALGYDWKSAQGAAHWCYEGRTLKSIREELESS